MTPMEEVREILPRLSGRATCPSNYYYSNGYCYPSSSWYFWGRWVLAAVVIVVAIVILLLLGCLSARRRRRRGQNPMYGTGWMGGKYAYNNSNVPPPPQQNYGPPPPQYSQSTIPNQYTGQTYSSGPTYNSNDGYYGNQSGVPLQQPAHVYNRDGGDHGYEPPPGPPPSKVA